MIRILLLLLTLGGVPGNSIAQTRYYVDINAGGQNNGQSWNDAFSSLHDALALALSGDEIWVAQGTYYPSAVGDRSARFQLTSGVKLYGSFAGSEMIVEERQVDLHPSILSGDIGIIGDSLDNSYTILHLSHPDLGTWVDGFTFRCGQADNSMLPNLQAGTSGAAIFIDGANSIAYPDIQNCIFEYNTARSNGGAIYVDGGGTGSIAPSFKNCRFYQNRSFLGSGGGVYRNGSSWLERSNDIESCQFIENWAARSGGGVYLNDAERSDTVNIVGCQFQGNWANLCSDAIAWGYTRNTGSHLKVLKCDFTKHHSSGTLMMDVFGQDLSTSAFYGIIDSCVFSNNSNNEVTTRTLIGGLRFFSESKWNISNTKIFQNTGSIFLCDESNRGEPHILKNIVLQNNSWNALFSISSDIVCENLSIHDNNAGLFFTWLNEIPGVNYNSALKLSNSEIYNNDLSIGFTDFRGTGSASINSCTFSNNKILNASAAFEVSKVVVTNSISANNNHISQGKNYPFLFDGLDTLYVSNSSLDTLPIPSPIHFYGPGSLFSTDPLFKNYLLGDLNLLPCSPLINAGSNLAAASLTTDLAGNPRIQDGIIDIGAYETPAFSLGSASTIKPACMGSSNGSILLQPVFGCEPYDYQWFPDAGDGPELTGLPPGAYQLTLTDGSGRKILDTLLVGLAPNPELAALSTDVQCGNTLGGTITAGTGNGTTPYHYAWQHAAADTAYLSHLSPGAYALTVTDANGCQDSASTHIALQGMITLMIGGQSISCFGESDGWLSATPATGASPFAWQWTGWPGTDSLAQPLGPGNYSVTVSDRYGCTASNTFPTMNAPDSLVIGTGTSPQTQNNPPNGAAVVTTVSGGTSPFDYFWETGGTDQSIAGLTAGLYTVTVTDDRGCTASATVEVKLMVGTADLELMALLIYPNPATDWVEVVLKGSQGLNGGQALADVTQMELSDESGRVLRRVEWTKGAVVGIMDLRGLPSGMYWLRGRNAAGLGLFVGKVLKR